MNLLATSGNLPQDPGEDSGWDSLKWIRFVWIHNRLDGPFLAPKSFGLTVSRSRRQLLSRLSHKKKGARNHTLSLSIYIYVYIYIYIYIYLCNVPPSKQGRPIDSDVILDRAYGLASADTAPPSLASSPRPSPANQESPTNQASSANEPAPEGSRAPSESADEPSANDPSDQAVLTPLPPTAASLAADKAAAWVKPAHPQP